MNTCAANKLALGTVQFGLNYGIANTRGQVSPEEVREILNMARNAGVDTLDTAIAYGNSEDVLGREDISGFRVITKLPEIPLQVDIHGWIWQQVQDSLQRLRQTSVYGLLLHRPGQLLDGRGTEILAVLNDLKTSGLVKKTGISIYAPAELDSLNSVLVPDIVQSPFNVLDQRLKTSGWLEKLKKQGSEIHVRSVFLQGLLLFSQGARPARFSHWQPTWEAWHQWLDQYHLNPLHACLRFAIDTPGIDRIVVGCDSQAQWREILQAESATGLPAIPDFSVDDDRILNPALWNSL